MLSFSEQIKRHIAAGAQIIWIYSPGDEGRCERELERILQEYTEEERLQRGHAVPDMVLHTWDAARGASWNPELRRQPILPLQSLPDPPYGMLLLRDGAEYLHTPLHIELRRELLEGAKTAAYNSGTDGSATVLPIVIITDRPAPPTVLREYVSVVDYSLPDFQMLRTDCVDYLMESLEDAEETIDEETKDKFASSLLGLSSEEAVRILSYVLVAPEPPETQLQMIATEKAKAIRKIPGLQYVPHEQLPEISDFGGFDQFISYLERRKVTYSRHAQACNIPRPRGVVLLGPPGTGKTTVAAAGAKVLGLDLVILDMGEVYEGVVGGTEKKIRACLATVEAMKNAYLVIDEIDKMLAGAHKNQTTDSGVNSRLLSYLLSWLSNRDMSDENSNRTFVMVTANRVDGLPPELLRPGRFDKIFSTDLPNAREARSIFEIHLRKRQINPEQYDPKEIEDFSTAVLAPRGREFSGAEIETVVIDAQVHAYYEAVQAAGDTYEELTAQTVQPDFRHFVEAAKMITPTAVLAKDDIKSIREFCEGRTTPVSSRKTKRSRKERE